MNRNGALITIVLVSVILFGLFHRIILNANRVSFASGGDGLKSTFGTVYHIKHDTGFWHTDAMNYPFGESVFFTGNQVVLTNTLKLLKQAGWDLSDYPLGISNILILLSYVIASLFIYLVFRELKVDGWMSVTASVIIILLCNQWERLGGHYNLAYAYMIPVILYLLLRFYRKPSYLLSAIIGILLLLFSAKQLYVAAFIMILLIPYWIFLALYERKRFGKPRFFVPHLLVQFILPFFLFNLFTGMHDPGLDRTAFPWGFYPSRILLEAVFLPEGLPHGAFIDVKGPVRSKAYVGLLGTVVALVIIYRLVAGLVRKDLRKAFAVSENPAWNILFWAGALSLLVALGLPFSLSWERLLNSTGPFRQLRAVGRFVFPFYYTMTITAFYFLWRWYRSSGWKYRTWPLVAILLFTGYEAVISIYKRPQMHNNLISWHSELYNHTPGHEWLHRHDFSRYQAILPLPYFHVGSENYWMGDRSPVQSESYAAAIGTGLPLSAVMLSRTSISQTLMSLDLVLEPYHEYPMLGQLPDNRPYLLIRHKKGMLTRYEEALVKKAEPLDESDQLKIYSLEPDSIRSLAADRQQELLRMVGNELPRMAGNELPRMTRDGLPGMAGRDLSADPQTPETSGAYLFQDYDSLDGGVFRADHARGVTLFEDFDSLDGGVFRADLRRPATFFEAVVPDTGIYNISFWFEGTARDLWPRTVFWTELFREDGSKYLYLYTDFFRRMVLRDGDWGLVEYPVHVKEPGTVLKITMKNRYITRGEMTLDRVLVLPEKGVHLINDQAGVWVNNRLIDTASR